MTVFETTPHGEARISPAFYAALAAALGAANLKTEGYGHGRMTLGDVSLSLRQGYGANHRRMTITAYAADEGASHRAYRAGRPVKFPEATLDPTRPLDALVKDIRKRLIDKSEPALRSIRDLDAAALAHSANLEFHAAKYREAFPRLQITVGDHEADVRGGVSARMNAAGGLYLQHLSLDADKARAVLAIILA